MALAKARPLRARNDTNSPSCMSSSAEWAMRSSATGELSKRGNELVLNELRMSGV